MFQILEGVSRDDIKRAVAVAVKLFFASLILIYFGGNLVFACCGIPICNDQWEEFAKDTKDWRQRCWNKSHGLMDSPCCEAEQEYFDERTRAHKQMCFYEGECK